MTSSKAAISTDRVDEDGKREKRRERSELESSQDEPSLDHKREAPESAMRKVVFTCRGGMLTLKEREGTEKKVDKAGPDPAAAAPSPPDCQDVSRSQAL